LRAPKEYFSAERYPKVFAWRDRFRKALKDAKNAAPKAVSLKGEDAVKFVTSADFTDKTLGVDEKDPLALKEGATVEMYPTDGGGYSTSHQVSIVSIV
jgi:hypothetical protein